MTTMQHRKNSAESLPYRTAERQKNARESDDVSAKIYKTY
jgi:hypothetical protein